MYRAVGIIVDMESHVVCIMYLGNSNWNDQLTPEWRSNHANHHIIGEFKPSLIGESKVMHNVCISTPEAQNNASGPGPDWTGGRGFCHMIWVLLFLVSFLCLFQIIYHSPPTSGEWLIVQNNQDSMQHRVLMTSQRSWCYPGMQRCRGW